MASIMSLFHNVTRNYQGPVIDSGVIAPQPGTSLTPAPFTLVALAGSQTLFQVGVKLKLIKFLTTGPEMFPRKT
ncbi:hypothetical protein E2C01_061589 [Portunus trituberculatus]|uniref:Uncharacterized protein n=1 Tax=Portunus trituberculatus TaxID=210409 RepID=A0A5B7HFH3_PORTR|nr:hypothetical protein [Portunus trituberculatus]